MGKEPKSIPVQAPPTPGRIADGLRAAVADPKSRRGAYIRLQITGGVRGESYDFDYRIDAGGRESGHLRDELNGRRTERPATDTKDADPARFAALVRALDIEELMRTDAPRGGFPPDSVVGRLEVSDGDQTASFLFLADEEQATRARKATPDSLGKAVDAVFDAAVRHLDTRDVRP